jgi:hypothetical protein
MKATPRRRDDNKEEVCMRAGRWLVAGLLAAVSGIAPTAATGWAAGEQDLEALRARVHQYWDARMKGDYKTAYAIEDPKIREGEKGGFQGYVAKRSGKGAAVEYKGYKVHKVQLVSAEKAEVQFEVDVVLHPYGVRTQDQSKDEWVKREGTWYRVYLTTIPTPPTPPPGKRP